jgi:hypothetical protein
MTSDTVIERRKRKSRYKKIPRYKQPSANLGFFFSIFDVYLKLQKIISSKRVKCGVASTSTFYLQPPHGAHW